MSTQNTTAPPTERESELLELLLEAQKLGLRFDIGNAYIRRVYIDKQEKLNERIAAIIATVTTDPHADGCPDSPGICECFRGAS